MTIYARHETDALKTWIKTLEMRPGVYLIQHTLTGACYVGAAEKSLRQRLKGVVGKLIEGNHHVALLQDDWNQFGPHRFAYWIAYAPSNKDALRDEWWLTRLARAWEDFGGYCLRTGENCVSASIRDTERKLTRQRSRRYQYLPGTNINGRINNVLVDTFCQGSTATRKTKRLDLGLEEDERLRQLEAWKADAHRYAPKSTPGTSNSSGR